MISATFINVKGLIFGYEIACDGQKWLCGLKEGGELFADNLCAYKELALRAIIARCQELSPPIIISTQDVWGLNLENFGFIKRTDKSFWAQSDALKLPRCCNKI